MLLSLALFLFSSVLTNLSELVKSHKPIRISITQTVQFSAWVSVDCVLFTVL